MLLPGKKGLNTARAACWLAAGTSPAQPDRCPKSLHLPSRPWPAFQTQPTGFRGAGGVPKHQGSRVKAFPGRTLCQEQHAPLISPSQPPKHEENPWGDVVCGENQRPAHGCLSVPSRAVQHLRNPQPGSAQPWARVAKPTRCCRAPTVAPQASPAGCKVPQGWLWCWVLLCKEAGEQLRMSPAL